MSVRPNARALRNSRSAVLSSLIELYHSSAHFLPLAASQLVPIVNPILAPLDNNSSHLPTPKKLGPVMESRGMRRFSAHQAHGQTSVGDLLERSASDYRERSTFDAEKSFHASWLSAIKTGTDHELVNKVRRTVDALHGTVAGGQASLHTLNELGEQAVAEAKQRKLESLAEAEEVRRQEARDASLEAHYAEEEEVARS